MTGIQVEQGNFARIHNTILEQLAALKLSGREANCLFYLFRKTYGYNKKEDTISFSQWMENVGFTKRHHAKKVLNGLAKRRVIYIIDNGNNRPKTYGFNKHFEQWGQPETAQTVTPQGNKMGQTVTPQGNKLGQTVTLQGDTPQGNRSKTVTPQGNKTVTPQGPHKRQKDRREGIGGGGSDAPTDYQRCVAIFEGSGFGTMTATLGEMLGDMIDDYTGTWVEDAIKLGAFRNKRSLSYVNGILKNWQADGKDWPNNGECEQETATVDFEWSDV